jgi:hypothetical protein
MVENVMHMSANAKGGTMLAFSTGVLLNAYDAGLSCQRPIPK